MMEPRIAPPRDFEDVLEKLVEMGLFETKQKALMYAAGLGWHKKERSQIDRKGEGVRYEVFAKDLDDGFIDALAIAECEDLNILSDERTEEKIRIFEEYAHTGLMEIRRVLSRPGAELDAFLHLAYDAIHNRDPSVPGIDPDILKDLAS